jgi:hypothetical protein
MPGHWVLARLGKRVLRPGGLELTRRMLKHLAIAPSDEVIEFAPGMGSTARLTLGLAPSSYTAVERDDAAAKLVSSYLAGPNQKCVVGNASETGLPAKSATVVYGEAMLTMQTDEVKRTIVREANRLLKQGGRYGIHEMCLIDEGLNAETKQAVERALTGVVHHGVRPLTVGEWRLLLASEGFEVRAVETAPMSLLEPGRLVKDEGVVGALRFVLNVLRDGEARRRVFEMRKTFRRNRKLIGAVAFLTIKQ